MDWPTEYRPGEYMVLSNMAEWTRRTGLLADKSDTALDATYRALFTPVYAPVPFAARKIYVLNGSTVTGKCQVGIASVGKLQVTSRVEPGIFLATSAVVDQVGTDVWQEFDIPETPLGRGFYFLAFSSNGGAGTKVRSLFTPVAAASGEAAIIGSVQINTMFPLFASSSGWIGGSTPTAQKVPCMIVGGVAL